MYLSLIDLVNIITLNELGNASINIQDEKALEIIEEVRQCILDRMDYLKVIQNLET